MTACPHCEECGVEEPPCPEACPANSHPHLRSMREDTEALEIARLSKELKEARQDYRWAIDDVEATKKQRDAAIARAEKADADALSVILVSNETLIEARRERDAALSDLEVVRDVARLEKEAAQALERDRDALQARLDFLILHAEGAERYLVRALLALDRTNPSSWWNTTLMECAEEAYQDLLRAIEAAKGRVKG